MDSCGMSPLAFPVVDIGMLKHSMNPDPIANGDKVIASGIIGEHGMALLGA
jgi:hydrogenase maturation factor